MPQETNPLPQLLGSTVTTARLPAFDAAPDAAHDIKGVPTTRQLFSLAFAAAIMAASPYPSFATQVADADASAYCGPDAPASYKRPGGFCDQLDNNKSLVTEPGDCPAFSMLDTAFDDNGRILVADSIYFDPCNPCSGALDVKQQLLLGNRVDVATIC